MAMVSACLADGVVKLGIVRAVLGAGKMKRSQNPQDLNEDELHLMAYYFYLERIASGAEGDAESDWSVAGDYLASVEAKAPRVDSQLGIVYPDRPEDSDALTLIGGIDAATEQRLNKCGIYRFAQIASWTPKIVAALGDLEQGIEQEDWIGQARCLATGMVNVA